MLSRIMFFPCMACLAYIFSSSGNLWLFDGMSNPKSLVASIVMPWNFAEQNRQAMEADQCTICLEPMSQLDSISSHCGHRFHKSCLGMNMQSSLSCPMCRSTLLEHPFRHQNVEARYREFQTRALDNAFPKMSLEELEAEFENSPVELPKMQKRNAVYEPMDPLRKLEIDTFAHQDNPLMPDEFLQFLYYLMTALRQRFPEV